jgi:hypothetical protein
MVLLNTSSRLIVCGPYKLIPSTSVKVDETKAALVKKYPRIGELFVSGALVAVKDAEAEKAKAEDAPAEASSDDK